MKKHITPVIHVVDKAQTFENVKIAKTYGAYGVFLISHGTMSALELFLLAREVKEAFAPIWVGVNALDLSAKDVAAQAPDWIDAIWTDNAHIDETADQQPYASEVKALLKERLPHVLYFGGIAFKYQQEVKEPRTAVCKASSWMDVVCTSGPGTGQAADVEKIRSMSGITSLAIASGITPENVTDYLPYVDWFLVATGISDDFVNINPDKLSALISNVQAWEDEQPYKLYHQLKGAKYGAYPYERVDLGEDMELIKSVFGNYWKPHYLVDHNAQTAVRFLGGDETLLTVSHDDILWETLEGMKGLTRAKNLSAHYPTFVKRYQQGVAEVEWQINPDGMYFMDSEGYGMTDDEEVALFGYIDRQGRVLAPFRIIQSPKELNSIKAEALQRLDAIRKRNSNQSNNNKMKTKIFNLIILDESGSMSGVTSQTIAGCNETINTIRTAQTKFADTQEHYVSIYAFQSEGNMPSRYLIKNIPATEVKHINAELYNPWGCTPLYDAVGCTLADLKSIIQSNRQAVGSVTIITDGMENASKTYTREKVAHMISALKEMGWSFNFIGANIDVQGTAASLNIDNAMEFQNDAIGTQQMFERERVSRMNYYQRTDNLMETPMDCELCEDQQSVFVERMKQAAANYFDDSEAEK